MLSQDLSFAWRTLRRRPAFAVIAVLTLALGLGANMAMFSVIRAVLLRPLPYESPDALVKMVGLDRETSEKNNLSPADFLDFARETRTLQRVGAHGWIGFFTIADGAGLPERVGGVNVTEGFFPTLGATFALGRSFTTDEDAPNGPRVVILSHGFWQRRFGGDRTIVGRTIDVNARPATVVGVLAESFRHVETNPEREADVFMPYGFPTTDANRGGHFIRAVGRLRGGVSVDQARAELTAIAARLERDHPQDNTNQGVHVAPLHDALVAEARPALLLLGAAVLFVLLVACANLGQPAAGAGRLAPRRARGACGDGRRPRSPGPPVDHRERGAVVAGRGRRSFARRDQHASAHHAGRCGRAACGGHRRGLGGFALCRWSWQLRPVWLPGFCRQSRPWAATCTRWCEKAHGVSRGRRCNARLASF